MGLAEDWKKPVGDTHMQVEVQQEMPCLQLPVRETFKDITFDSS
jgi:hypothetical protein